MRIFKDRADRDRELLFALRALIQASSDFLIGIFLDFPDALLLVVLAVRAKDAELPTDFF